jgi:hypothetical protein
MSPRRDDERDDVGEALDPERAAELLAGADLVPFLTGQMAYAKEMLSLCLEAGIPALLGRPAAAGKS